MTADGALSDFSVAARFADGQVVLALEGEVDIMTAPEFGAFFETMIDRGHRSVVLDLAGLRFMDASGLAVIARGADRLEVTGGTLTIRTPIAMIGRLLDITGFARLVQLEPRETSYGHLGPEQSHRRKGDPPLGDHVQDRAPDRAPDRFSGMTKGVTKFTSIHSDDELIDGALRMAVSLAGAAVGGADGVSVSLRRRGVLTTVAATDQTVLTMDANQYETGEGPCVDASTEGHWFHAESLESESRWPAFTPRARALGIRAILSSPLLVEDRPVGALNIYSLTPSVFSVREQELAAAFAAQASSLLGDAVAGLSDDELSIRFQGALRARQVIAQAQGVLMEREGISENDAYGALRRFSLGNGRPLHEMAEHVVASTRRGPTDTDG
jgi:anti-anti-sigma factor